MAKFIVFKTKILPFFKTVQVCLRYVYVSKVSNNILIIMHWTMRSARRRGKELDDKVMEEQ